MRGALVVVALLGGCYREDGSKPIVTNSSDPALLADDPACRRGDDIDTQIIDTFPEGRLRVQRSGSLSMGAKRSWGGDEIPPTIPTNHGTQELFLLDPADGGYLAYYRDPYGAGSCTLGGKQNCAYLIEHYDRNAKLVWSLPLNPLMSRADGLEVQDIRLANGVVYFNEACQSYSSEQGGKCSSLVAVDPRASKVLWRTPSLVSNSRFVIRGCYLVTGYGFTAEPDNVFLVERATGKVVQTIPVSSAPQVYRIVNGERLDVTLYSGLLRRYKLVGMQSHAGRIVEMDKPEAMYGGAGYGGAAYGGYGVGGNTYGGATYGGRRP